MPSGKAHGDTVLANPGSTCFIFQPNPYPDVFVSNPNPVVSVHKVNNTMMFEGRWDPAAPVTPMVSNSDAKGYL